MTVRIRWRGWALVWAHDLRHRLASWLIGCDTRRAVYLGSEAVTIHWEADENIISVDSIYGAEIGLLIGKDGSFRTVFSSKDQS